MKNKFFITLLSVILLITGSCCKEKTVPKQATNIKSIKLVYNNIQDTFRYSLFYDSLNQLNKVLSDTVLIYQLTNINSHTIKIDIEGHDFPIFVHLNAQNRIICVNGYEDYITADAQSYYATYSVVSTFADTILHPDYFYFEIGSFNVFSNISIYDFKYNSGNCINHKLASTDVFNGNQSNPTFDTFSIDMSYNSSLKNNNLLPLQNSYLHFYDLGDPINIFYFLSLNGYYYIQSNANLLQTKQTIDLGGLYHTTYYEYKTDANENVTEMCVRHYSTLDSCDKYFFEYY